MNDESNAIISIPELLATLMIGGCITTINAMDREKRIAQTIRD